MKKTRRALWIVILLIGVPALACTLPVMSSGNSGAEETLQAIYAQQTQEALAQPAQPAQAPQEVPAAVVPAAPEPTATTQVNHVITPVDMGWVAQYANDTSSTAMAAQKRVSGGDNIGQNLYERPFTATEMLYHPEVDLQRVEISSDANFLYFQLILSGVSMDTSTLSAHYGVELDTDIDGRGDLLAWALGDANTTWNIDNVFVYRDNNNNVGGNRPVYADAMNTGDGYETLVFSPQNLQDPDTAWKRVSPTQGNAIQLAVKKSLLGGTAIWMWHGWADAGVADPARFDYDDTFPVAVAGSPINGDANYPLKALSLVDNTCRLAFGFNPTGKEPGGCFIPPPPTAVPTAAPTVTLTPVPIIQLIPAPCLCAFFPNAATIDNEACCTFCGHVWNPAADPEWPCSQ